MPKRTRLIKTSDAKAAKPWLKKAAGYRYPVETVSKRKRFLIVCEGQTEELYFKSFPVLTADVKAVHQGASKMALVRCVAHYTQDEVYDEIWCVFDMDFKPGQKGQYQDFNNAVTMAQKAGYKCAYSNDAFELWFVLHYRFIDEQKLRTFFFEVLSAYWGLSYEKEGKSRSFAHSLYNRLFQDERASQQMAVKNARKLMQQHRLKKYHQQNPATTVYLLVEELNKHLRR